MTDSVIAHEHAQSPPALAPLHAAIQESRYFLDWDDDWDDEGSPAYNEAVWRRATDFLLRTATHLLERYQVVIPVPSITPGPDGSIDIHWRNLPRELLLNVPPADPDNPPSFFGDDRASNELKGHIDLNTDCSWLLMWLIA